MINAKNALKQVLEEIQPDETYKKEIFEKLDSIISKINIGQKNFKAILGGSGAKGTWLKSFDADIFVLFNYSKYKERSEHISDILEKTLRKRFKKTTRLHGSRDYFQINEKNYTFEIIPILEIKNSKQAVNITDISPLHSKWVLRHKKLADEMKLTKQFCKAQRIYGAESHLRGFSGYVCEILAVNYGSFEKLAKAAAKWQDKIVIDVEKYYKNQDVFNIMNSSKLESPMIAIDPVQKERNAAAALSFENFCIFRTAAKSFVFNPSKKLFEIVDIQDSIKKRYSGYKIIKIEILPLNGKNDVIGSKIQKINEFIFAGLLKNEFKIRHSALDFTNKLARAYFVFNKNAIEKEMTIEGPPLRMENHVSNFKKNHKKTFLKKGKIFAVEKRKFLLPEKLLDILSKNPYISERCKEIKIKVL